MASDNPTKTRGIEKAWNREINRRFSEFRKSVIGRLREFNKITVNRFEVDPDQIRIYMTYFQSELNRLVVGDWQEKYQERSYQLSIERMNAELKRQGAALASGGAVSGEAVAAFGSISIGAFNPVHREALSFLYTRSFEALSGMSQEMARTVRNILFNGVQEGLGINEIARQVNRRIDVGRSRSRLIAQTETIQAYQRGTINQAELASEFLGEEVKLRWLTRRDSKVRHLHAKWHGKIFSAEDTFRNINISPWNCRCGQTPVIKEADTAVKQKKFDKERKQLRELEN